MLLVPSEQATAASKRTEQPKLETSRIIMILPAADDLCLIEGICGARYFGILALRMQLPPDLSRARADLDPDLSEDRRRAVEGSAEDVAADSAANFYAAGYISGANPVDFGSSATGTGAYSGGYNAVLVKYR